VGTYCEGVYFSELVERVRERIGGVGGTLVKGSELFRGGGVPLAKTGELLEIRYVAWEVTSYRSDKRGIRTITPKVVLIREYFVLVSAWGKTQDRFSVL